MIRHQPDLDVLREFKMKAVVENAPKADIKLKGLDALDIIDC